MFPVRKGLTLCRLHNFACLFADFFFKINFQGIPSKCQTVWIQIRLDVFRPDLGPNCLGKVAADDTSRQRVNPAVLRMAKLYKILT